MPFMLDEVVNHFESMIYLPMVIQILERDRGTIEFSPFKLKGPYINIVENALEMAQSELKESNTYARNKKMKLIKKSKDDMFTEYVLIHGGHEHERRYLNVRLRNRTEELISVYFDKSFINPEVK
ncbi:hypothetical protein [Sporosarcina sp. NPDC096371]|uniref:hypothetical protein n=1 Tax=Sporosarcina sp. NPDC096371 TaxID=3364530 RepID=UPI003818FA54